MKDKIDILLEKLKYSMSGLYQSKEKELLKVTSSYIFREPTKLIDNKKNKYILHF